MNREEVLYRVNEIFKDAFDREDMSVSFDTAASDVEGWDSMMQMNLVEMVEDEFGIQFRIDDIVEMENVGKIVELILANIT